MNIYSRTRTIYLFWLINVRFRAELEGSLEQFNVTPGQYIVMSYLRNQRQYSAAELARKTGVSAQSTSELTVALERKGYITRTPEAKNQRILRIALSLEGVKLLAEIDSVVDRMEESIFSSITSTELSIIRTSIIALLDKMADDVSQRE